MIFTDLETERLRLENISSEDKEFIFEQFSNNDVNKYLFDAEPMVEPSEAQELIDFYMSPEPRNRHRWILVRKSDGLTLGTCGFHFWNQNEHKIETGYDLRKEFWGNGYMLEAMKAIIDFGESKLDVKRIDANIYIENEKSIALAKKLGFEFYGETELFRFRGRDYLHHIFTRNRK